MYIYIYIYTSICIAIVLCYLDLPERNGIRLLGTTFGRESSNHQAATTHMQSVETNYRKVDFRNVIVFFGPRPWHIEIRYRVKKKTSTIDLFGFETLRLKIRRLKLRKPTACSDPVTADPLCPSQKSSANHSIAVSTVYVCVISKS